MNPVRALSVVPNCPQPDPPAAKPIVYGQAPWSRLPPSPPAHEISIRVRAQSLLSREGKRAELPDYETALRIIARANKPSGRSVTVPAPKSMPASAPNSARLPSPRMTCEAGSPSKQEKQS
jgi:hypothetical protein